MDFFTIQSFGVFFCEPKRLVYLAPNQMVIVAVVLFCVSEFGDYLYLFVCVSPTSFLPYLF